MATFDNDDQSKIRKIPGIEAKINVILTLHIVEFIGFVGIIISLINVLQ